MPIKEFQCDSCKYEFEEIVKATDYTKLLYGGDSVTCPKCDGETLNIKEIPSESAGQFSLKGHGWTGKLTKS